ncbi:phosphatase PAP2 family protein [Leptolyngbya boryana CZ1]|uniref:Phosphatase PAP2 family protein n=1 Tax=Leptolyngbya boryana CZ1 TaxID=3060204 RepID=A0AA96WQF7_LEPBY|nr:phosphatase PAP2 family protein [Leptolyngbya boryana]WNZ43962.1 phosphatase PAP2 family protein [Leptolyngbya boryana CZ1]
MFNFDVQQFLQAFLEFLKHLLAARRGALLMLLIGVLLPLLIFGELAEDVWENQGGFPWDVPILLAVHSVNNPWLDAIATFLTKLGVFWGVFPVATGVGVFLLFRRWWYALAYLITTLTGSIVINRTAKLLLHRVRPHLWQSPAPEFDYGFPSGHAMSSMTFVTVLIILTWQTKWRWWVLLLGGLFVLMIAWTRLYLGVHYPSDILAGWLISIAWAIGVSLLINPQRRNVPLHSR